MTSFFLGMLIGYVVMWGFAPLILRLKAVRRFFKWLFRLGPVHRFLNRLV